jgi:hypothetical protein
MQEEATMACFKSMLEGTEKATMACFKNMLEGTEKDHKNPQSE